METVLIIESNPFILANLTEAFEMEGYNILSANNGSKGVELAVEFMPHLIVSEIHVGKMNGYEVLHVLMNTHATSGIPFIFSTTKSENRDRVLALELGADDYIIKPYELDHLLTMSKMWIKSGRQRVAKQVSVCA